MEYAFNGLPNDSGAYHQTMDYDGHINQDPRKYTGIHQVADHSRFGFHYWPQSGSERYESENYQSSATLGGAGYRSPLRHGRFMREMNSRNGLYSPLEQSGRRGGPENYHTSLPGFGALETPTFKPGNTKSPW
ncbi:uncharacterized protein Dwil_GK18720 [Drosophila willistoni]|uniref:Uncharacterized protein n=1 Tax=Drosophila willistoni TaxID=7260 RepID=B4N7M0_DROWI|nr:uncharacterized protein LOC6646708 [Drosophila willistoni]EDW80359.1 uncharacterized protein Dwil_GK18720 [Drosophila willistoni]